MRSVPFDATRTTRDQSTFGETQVEEGKGKRECPRDVASRDIQVICFCRCSLQFGGKRSLRARYGSEERLKKPLPQTTEFRSMLDRSI